MPIREFVHNLILQPRLATPEQLGWLITQAGAAPFVEDLLEVDAPLWGGFWQGDVISPGYSLPAVELALLRATRLDAALPEGTSVAEFLADLRQAISNPHAGVWTLAAAGEPCIVFAAPFNVERSNVQTTVVWYCATTERLHAGYRTALEQLNFRGAIEQRKLRVSGATHLESASHLGIAQPGWLEQAVEPTETTGGQRSAVGGQPFTARLDAEILRLRFNASE
jgi:hypothetical protein